MRGLFSRYGLVLVVFLLFISSVNPLFAVSPDSQSMRIDQKYEGQYQYYTVYLAKSGEALVHLKVIFTNDSNARLNHLVFNLDSVQPQSIKAYQAYRDPVCISYPQIKTMSPRQLADQGINGLSQIKPCLQYKSVDYYLPDQSLYPVYAPIDYRNGLLQVDLPYGVMPHQQGAIIISYRAYGYLKNYLPGSKTLRFSTLISDQRTHVVNIGFDIDDAWVVRSQEAQLFKSNTILPIISGLQSLDTISRDNSAFIRYYDKLGHGQVNHYSRDLPAGETFVAENTVASSYWQLYMREIFIVVLIFIGLILLIIGTVHHLVKKGVHHKIRSDRISEKYKQRQIVSFVVMMSSSMFASGAICAGTYLLFFLLRSLAYVQFGTFMPLVILFVGLFAFPLYLILLFGPALIIGIKRGIWWGAGAYVMTLIWLIFGVMILVVTMTILHLDLQFIQPVPIPGGGRTLDRSK